MNTLTPKSIDNLAKHSKGSLQIQLFTHNLKVVLQKSKQKRFPLELPTELTYLQAQKTAR